MKYIKKHVESFVVEALGWSKLKATSTPSFELCTPTATFDVYDFGIPEGRLRLEELLRYVHTSQHANRSRSTLVIAGCDSELGSPPRNWDYDADYFGVRHNVFWDRDEGLVLASDASRGIWAFGDLPADHYLLWIDDIASLPYWEHAAPIRNIIHWSTLNNGDTLAHMATYGLSGVYVGLTGPSGVGKSTTTAAAIAEGFDVLAEDLTSVNLASGGPYAQRIYDSIKVTEDALAKFGFLRDLSASSGCEKLDKTVFALPPTGGGYQPLRALFSLSGRFADKVHIAPAPKHEVFHRLAPATVFLLRTGGRLVFHRLAEMVRRLPTFEVTPGADARATARAIYQIAETGGTQQ